MPVVEMFQTNVEEKKQFLIIYDCTAPNGGRFVSKVSRGKWEIPPV